MNTSTRRALEDCITQCFTLQELGGLATDMGFHAENVVVAGTTLDEASRRLIDMTARYGLDGRLIAAIQRLRPNHPRVRQLDSMDLAADDPVEQPVTVTRGDRAAVRALMPDGVVTVMFSDIVGYSSMSKTRSDRTVQALRLQHDAIVRQQLQAYHGHEVKTLGDGFMIAFARPSDAVLCGLAIQSGLSIRNAAEPHDPIHARIGMHTGEVLSEPGDYSGDAVNHAARVGAVTQSGQVWVTDAVRVLVEGRLAVRFTDKGLFDLKGQPKPTRLYEVTLADEDPATRP